MYTPKKTKYRVSFVNLKKGKASRGISMEFGEVGLISTENTYITSRQIEAARKVISHTTKRTGKLWLRVFPDQTMTSKAANVRMGSGKGALSHYVAVIRKGRILFEVGGIDKELASLALTKAAKKLPMRTKLVEKEY